MPTPKAYDLIIERRASYLYAHVKSRSPHPAVAKEYLKEITEKCREMQCNRIVIDNDVPKAFGVWDIFPVAVRLLRMGLECTKVAVIDKIADPIGTDEFSVLVGSKTAINLHIFDNLAEAESWIIR